MELSVKAQTKADAVPLALVMQSLSILSLDACALEENIQKTLLENPLLEAAPAAADSTVKEYLFAQIRKVSTLSEDLHRQLGCLRIPERLARAASLLIDCLDDDGYLREDLSLLAAEWRLEPAFLEEALAVVQGLEPTGVGCRDLAECLKLQLLEQQPRNDLALDIVCNHLTDLADRTFPFEDYDPDQLAEAMEAIHSLSPRPCASCGEDHTQYIVPDIRVFLEDSGELRAELINQPLLPVLSPLYHDYLKAGTDTDKLYVRGQLDTARNYIHSLQMRARTLGLIAQFLITRQRDYFLLGPEAHRSISLTSLAEGLELNVSTISRAVSGKYVEFRGRVFPLREMFHSNGAGELSRTAITRRIHDLLREEPGLSDSKIAARLEAQGIKISRRTVNKYRNLTK